jgi:hypothetical protein
LLTRASYSFVHDGRLTTLKQAKDVCMGNHHGWNIDSRP